MILDHHWRIFLLLFEGFLFVLPAIEGSPFMFHQTYLVSQVFQSFVCCIHMKKVQNVLNLNILV